MLLDAPPALPRDDGNLLRQRFVACLSGLASGLALAVRPAGLAEVSRVNGARRRCALETVETLVTTWPGLVPADLCMLDGQGVGLAVMLP